MAQNLPVVKDSWLWFKGSDGNASVSTTLLTVAFVVTTLAYIASVFEAIGPVKFRTFDVAACSSYFLPLACLYFGRRTTEAKIPKVGATPEVQIQPPDNS